MPAPGQAHGEAVGIIYAAPLEGRSKLSLPMPKADRIPAQDTARVHEATTPPRKLWRCDLHGKELFPIYGIN